MTDRMTAGGTLKAAGAKAKADFAASARLKFRRLFG